MSGAGAGVRGEGLTAGDTGVQLVPVHDLGLAERTQRIIRLRDGVVVDDSARAA